MQGAHFETRWGRKVKVNLKCGQLKVFHDPVAAYHHNLQTAK